jgi:hypothetical protein
MACNNLISDTDIENIYKDGKFIDCIVSLNKELYLSFKDMMATKL